MIGQARIEQPGNPPIKFEIRYDPSQINERHHYWVRARILVDGKPFFITAQGSPVLTSGKGNELQLQLRKVGASATATEPLENTYCKLMRLGDAPVTVPPRQREPHLILNSMAREMGGSGGCNQLSGSYEVKGDRLTLGPATTTIDGQLELLDAGGKVVARLEARHLE